MQDRQQWNNICCALGSKCYLIAEDAATYISKLKMDHNVNIPTCSGVVLKYINQAKVSDLIGLTGLLDGEWRGGTADFQTLRVNNKECSCTCKYDILLFNYCHF